MPPHWPRGWPRGWHSPGSRDAGCRRGGGTGEDLQARFLDEACMDDAGAFPPAAKANSRTHRPPRTPLRGSISKAKAPPQKYVCVRAEAQASARATIIYGRSVFLFRARFCTLLHPNEELERPVERRPVSVGLGGRSTPRALQQPGPTAAGGRRGAAPLGVGAGTARRREPRKGPALRAWGSSPVSLRTLPSSPLKSAPWV